ncbi:MAG: UTP--glucose-1-phosphate uridylyltransferase GalU [Bdellovibrionales bacterium]
MNNVIRKAVIPAAGLGTRFLPATKSIPKEMLTIVDKPILLYVVEEAVKAGIQDIVLIQGRGKGAIEDFFDTSVELETVLERSGKQGLLETIRKVKDMANIISVRQKNPHGLGHAVYMARPVVGDEPFALLLGDEIMINGPQETSAIGQLAELHQKYNQSVVAVMEVAASDVSKYGVVSGSEKSPGLLQVEKLVEKPDPASSPSRLAMPGRYVFTSTIFKYLKDAKPGKNGEIQLTDAMAELARHEGLLATQVKTRRYDAGDRFGYLQANIELALDRPDLRQELIPYLQALNARLSKGK